MLPQVRKEREELDALREQRAQELKERMDKLRLRREHKHTAAREAHASKVREQGRMVRQEVRDLEQARDEHNQEHWRRARERVEVANNLDAKLDAAEAAQDQRERDEAAEARAVLAKRAAAAKEKADAKRNFLNEKVRQAHAQAAARKQSNLATKRMRAGQTQDAKRQWNEAEQSNKQAHLTEARRKAQKRAKEKAEAKERMNEAAAKRRAAAREEKRNNEDATAALEAEVKKNQLARCAQAAGGTQDDTCPLPARSHQTQLGLPLCPQRAFVRAPIRAHRSSGAFGGERHIQTAVRPHRCEWADQDSKAADQFNMSARMRALRFCRWASSVLRCCGRGGRTEGRAERRFEMKHAVPPKQAGCTLHLFYTSL